MKKSQLIQMPLVLALIMVLFSACSKDNLEVKTSDDQQIEKIANTYSGWDLLGPEELASFDPANVFEYLETLTSTEIYELTYIYEVANFFEENNIQTKDYFYGRSYKAVKGMPFHELLSEAQLKEFEEKIIENNCDIANIVETINVWVYRGTWVRIEVNNPLYKVY